MIKLNCKSQKFIFKDTILKIYIKYKFEFVKIIKN